MRAVLMFAVVIGITSGLEAQEPKASAPTAEAYEVASVPQGGCQVMRALLISHVFVLFLVASGANAQGPSVTAAQAAPFLGTWVFTMTEPPHFKGSMQTVKVWDEGGKVAASVQLGKFPASNVTGMYSDSDMLVLTISREATSPIRENGVALRAVIMLTPDGDGMRMAQMLDASETIKRGVGKRDSF